MAEIQPINIAGNMLAGYQGAQQVQDARQLNQLRGQQMQQATAAQKRDADFRNALKTYMADGTNGLAALYAADPERAMQVQTFQGQQNQLAAERKAAEAKRYHSAGQYLLDSEAPKALLLMQARSGLNPDNPFTHLVTQLERITGKPIDDLTDDQIVQFTELAMPQLAAQAGLLPEKEEAYTLKPGDTRYVGSKKIVSVPSDTEGSAGFTLSQGQTRFGPDGKPIASVATAPLSDATRFGQADKLRDEFNKQSTEFIGVANSYQRIKDSVSDPSAAGDLALIFNFMKVLDPGSTVREGEFATAQNSGSVPSQIIARYNKVLNGERLAADQRKDFTTRAKKLYEGQQGRWEKNVKGRYEKLAKELGVDSKYVIGDFGVPEEASVQPAQEVTATGPGGQKIVLRNGQWVPLGQ